MVEYKDSIKLPKTAFPMKANLANREPEFIKRWDDERVYEKVLEKNKGNEKFIFHDGPPYANGNIHHGHILNKVLKDMVVKYRSLKGNYVYYRPGWDCHGLPIELNAERELGKPSDDADKLSIRERCHDFAMKWSKVQMGEMRRMGIFSDWDRPYRTIQPDYEAAITNNLAKIVERDMVYRGHKPVYWCADCGTALAEAEVEHQNHKSPSVYVKYPVLHQEEMRSILGLEKDDKPLNVMIWTTTPWTLPASLVVAVNPKYQYSAYEVDGEYIVIAVEMSEPTFKFSQKEGTPVGKSVAGAALERLHVKHPFIDREVPILLADYVTLEAGTGCVHTAPGHGQDDYVLCSANGIDVYAPVDKSGRFTDEVPQWAGMLVWDANPKIVEHLHEIGALFNPPGQKLEHQYPACWRCKNPIIFRATPQWFISMDKTGLRQKALSEIDKTQWIPPWGHDRIHGMVENRPDWCISRQRVWGVPLPFFFCESCEESLVDADVVRHVAQIFGEHGSDEWFKRDASDLIPTGTKCQACGEGTFIKEENIVDVWFESGVSWDAVCNDNEDLGLPADLYLEGSDQHRGWFHTSLLTSVGTQDVAPYKAVLTHGFICNEKGEILSKSQKNFVSPDKTINREGAEILRLWVSYEDYRSDIGYSQGIIKSLVDSYRKIRNTFRFMLGNLNGFDPAKHTVPVKEMTELDRWMLSRFGAYINKLDRAYSEYNFHHIFHQTIELVTIELSAFYCDIVKDRLYCEDGDGKIRRAAQTVLYTMARDMARVLSPVLSFTAEEIWQYLPEGPDKVESVFLSSFPEVPGDWHDQALMDKYQALREVRKVATKELEDLRRAGEIGNSLQASIVIQASGATLEMLQALGTEEIADLFLVSEVAIEAGEGEVVVKPVKTEAEKCPRCWRHGHGVGKDSEYSELCERCATVVRAAVASGDFTPQG